MENKTLEKLSEFVKKHRFVLSLICSGIAGAAIVAAVLAPIVGTQASKIAELELKVNEEYKGLHVKGNTTFIVNTGISDWKTSFKTGTKSEYVIVNIRSTYEKDSSL